MKSKSLTLTMMIPSLKSTVNVRKQHVKLEIKMMQNLNENVLAIQLDLQAVPNTPKGASGPFFYVRKLAVYNLTIYNLKDASVICCVLDETEGNRGSIEVSTCIYTFFMSQTNVEFVRMMSDSCGGQQKNSKFISMCMHVIKEHPSIKQIDHRFLIIDRTWT